MTVLIAQLTDTHVVDADAEGHVPDEVYVDNNGRLASAVASLNAEAPAMAVVLGTGDLTNWGRPGEYERLAAPKFGCKCHHVAGHACVFR